MCVASPRYVYVPPIPFTLADSSTRYDLDDHPSGASTTSQVCPNKAKFGEFRDNTAHTCNEFGLRIWETYIPHVSKSY